MIKAVIFDLDGVILDTERLNVSFKLELSKKLGYSLTRNDIVNSLGLGKKEAIEYFYKLVNNYWLYEQMSKYRKERTMEFIKKNNSLPLRPYALETLNFLKSHNIKVALATSSTKQLLDNYFAYTNLYPYFDVVITNDMVEKGKPNPDIFLKASQELAINVEDIIVVEDSINGLKAAKAGRFKTVFIEDQWSMTKDKIVYADYVLSNMENLKVFFDN